MKRIVIAGASVAGLSAADTLREEGFEGEIVMLSDESVEPYDRPPLSKEFLTQADADLERGRPLRLSGHFEEMGIDLRLASPALGIDTECKVVLTPEGEIAFDGLVIATGCRTRTLPVTGDGHLPVVRNLADARTLREALSGARSAVLIGSGFIGLETAAGLSKQGLAVTVIGNTPRPLQPRLGPEIGDWVQRLHERHGVTIRNGTTVAEVAKLPHGYRVLLNDGSAVEADIAVAGIGVIPNTEWLQGSGILCDNGVVCNAQGQTSVPSIFAAGDVASYPMPDGQRRRIEHWTNAAEQGRHVALELLGKSESPFRALPYAWSDQFDLKIQTFGWYCPGHRTDVIEGSLDCEDFLALHSDEGRLTGITVSGMSPNMRTYRRLLQKGAYLEEALEVARRQAA